MHSIFKQKLEDTPREVLNWRLWIAVITFAIMGAARGLDEGAISGTVAQISFIEEYGLKDPNLTEQEQADRLGNIASMAQIGSVLGALVAFIVSDRIGRIWATRQLCLIWLVGLVLFLTANGNIGMVYAGRFIAGMGMGQTTVVAPTYLAEVAPRSVRGLCICLFSSSTYFGLLLTYFASWGTSLHISDNSNLQWVIPTSLNVIFAGSIFCLTFVVKESPRYLAKVGKHEEAAATMAYIRNLPADHPYVQPELMDIRDQLHREHEATVGVGFLGLVKELFFLPGNRYRIMVGLTSQLLCQWSGATSITLYAPEFFALLGASGQSERLLATALFGVVKLVSGMICTFFLIDFLGRKRSLGIGIILQLFSILYVAVYLAVAPRRVDLDDVQSPHAKGSDISAMVAMYVSGAGWALGWNNIQYLINAEIFPLRVRSLGSSMVMCAHFLFQYGSSKAVPKMLLESAWKAQGTFFFFVAVLAVGLVWAWFFLPETAGKSLEGMDELFSLPWWLIGRKGAKLTAAAAAANAANAANAENGPIVAESNVQKKGDGDDLEKVSRLDSQQENVANNTEK